MQKYMGSSNCFLATTPSKNLYISRQYALSLAVVAHSFPSLLDWSESRGYKESILVQTHKCSWFVKMKNNSFHRCLGDVGGKIEKTMKQKDGVFSPKSLPLSY